MPNNVKQGVKFTAVLTEFYYMRVLLLAGYNRKIFFSRRIFSVIRGEIAGGHMYMYLSGVALFSSHREFIILCKVLLHWGLRSR